MEIMDTTLVAIIVVKVVVVITPKEVKVVVVTIPREVRLNENLVVMNPFIMIESPKELKVVVTPLNLLPSFETPFSLVTLLLAGYNCGYWAFGLDICSCIGPSILSYV